MQRTKVCRLGWTCLVASALSSCSLAMHRDAASTALVIADGSDTFPSAETVDWVSYALHISVMRVISETEIPMSREETQRGEGLVGRNVTLRTERVLWLASKTASPPTEITLRATGWIVHAGKRKPFAMRGAPRLEVGRAYVMPLTQVDGEWSLLSPSAVVLVSPDGRATAQATADNTAAIAAAGMTPDQLADRLAHTQADPVALKYAYLPPYERARAVIAEKQAAESDR